MSKEPIKLFVGRGLAYPGPGDMANGIYTAHSHPSMQQHFNAEVNYVWPDPRGEFRGFPIEPSYKDVAKAVKSDEKLYKMLD